MLVPHYNATLSISFEALHYTKQSTDQGCGGISDEQSHHEKSHGQFVDLENIICYAEK